MIVEVGKIYRVKSWEQMKEEYGLDSLGNIKVPFFFTQDMKYLCGKDILVTNIDDNCIYDKTNPRWIFSKEMLSDLSENTLRSILKNKNLL